MKKSFDELLMEQDSLFKGSISAIIANLGRVVAIITLCVASLVTFTDVAISGIGTKNYCGMLIMMIISAYVMYFSLLDVGEKKGEESEEFKSAKAAYSATRVKIKGDMIGGLRIFCEEYSKKELETRRKNKLLEYGFSHDDINTPTIAESARFKKAIRRVERMKATPLYPRTLLSSDPKAKRNELCDPSRGRIPRSLVKLIPSTVCMCVTVSVALSFKDGMSAADVINGLIKLCALPIIGIRAYASGIVYSCVAKVSWLETKTRILEAFLEDYDKEK